MPCLILTGHPCSGKTTLAKLIQARSPIKVVVVNEEVACPNQTRQQCYQTSAAEKATRGALKTALDRALAEHPEALCILDSLNYIKGFRYELHCLSKAQQQAHGVVWVLNDLATERRWNDARRASQQDEAYSEDLLEALVLRYEPPDERNRWDKPLFPIHMVLRDKGKDVNASGAAASQALEQSVYNMHNLSSVLTTTEQQSSANDAEEKTQPGNTEPSATAASTTTKKKPKAKFKRANKKPTPESTETGAREAGVVASAGTQNAQEPTTTQQDKLELNDGAANPSHRPSGPSDANAPRRSIEQQVDDMLNRFLNMTPALQQNMSTQVQTAHANADLMHLLDKVTNGVCHALAERASSSNEDSSLTITNLPGTATATVTIPLPVNANDPQLTQPASLQSRRRQYLNWCATHPPDNSDSVSLAQAFCDYLFSVT